MLYENWGKVMDFFIFREIFKNDHTTEYIIVVGINHLLNIKSVLGIDTKEQSALGIDTEEQSALLNCVNTLDTYIINPIQQIKYKKKPKIRKTYNQFVITKQQNKNSVRRVNKSKKQKPKKSTVKEEVIKVMLNTNFSKRKSRKSRKIKSRKIKSRKRKSIKRKSIKRKSIKRKSFKCLKV
jgi:hypothetical protein